MLPQAASTDSTSPAHEWLLPLPPSGSNGVDATSLPLTSPAFHANFTLIEFPKKSPLRNIDYNLLLIYTVWNILLVNNV